MAVIDKIGWWRLADGTEVRVNRIHSGGEWCDGVGPFVNRPTDRPGAVFLGPNKPANDERPSPDEIAGLKAIIARRDREIDELRAKLDATPRDVPRPRPIGVVEQLREIVRRLEWHAGDDVDPSESPTPAEIAAAEAREALEVRRAKLPPIPKDHRWVEDKSERPHPRAKYLSGNKWTYRLDPSGAYRSSAEYIVPLDCPECDGEPEPPTNIRFSLIDGNGIRFPTLADLYWVSFVDGKFQQEAQS
jgi:hypothetical protein